MVLHSTATSAPHPDAVEFVRFCYHRRRVGWPELYDEMCAVAGRGLYRGLSADDLGGIGVGFSLFDMPALANLAARVVAEELALRRPMRVVIADESQVVREPQLAAAAIPVTAIPVTAIPGAATEPKPPIAPQPVALRAIPIAAEERPFEGRRRLSLASSGT